MEKIRANALEVGDEFEMFGIYYVVISRTAEGIFYRIKKHLWDKKSEFYFGLKSKKFINKKGPDYDSGPGN